jgi:hypothetical protein
MLSTNFRAARLDSDRSASNPTSHRLAPRALLAGSLAFALIACAPAAVTPANGSGGKGNGGSSGSGGNGSGGSGSGGTSAKGGSGGNGSGGSGSGGTSAKGGSGGNGSGGAGGNGSGGSSVKGGSGGNGSGGAAGNGSGGNGSGGSAGGASGSGSGGAAGTGSGGAAGTGSGGSSGGGASGSNPPGWYTTKDWGVSSVDWHGCVWTGVDCKSNCPAGITAVPGSTTSVTPADFTGAATEGGPYQVTGSVFNDYNSVVLLGFDLNDTPTGDATQCKNANRDPSADGPPAVTMPSGATGIAVNWSAAKLPADFRIQIQGVKGATDPTNRWCASISGANGPSFVPFSSFSTTCWNTTGTKYNNEPISGVAFLAPGTTSEVRPFDFTVVGFAPGTSAADAPGKAAACGTKTGTVGTTSLLSDATKATAASAERVAVSGTDCKTYIINNNNWGQQSTTYQALDYVGNSFTINVTSGSGGGANVVSFPSIYIGANGDLGVGNAYNTWADSGLPKQISAIKSAKSTFAWSGGNGGNYNAAYDIWFAKSSPTPGYNDGVSGFIMIWNFKPGSSQPIGDPGKTRSATIDGKGYHVWRGGRNATATGTDGTGRPVISYVADSTNNNFSSDLKLFFDDAVKNAADDMSNGTPAITQAFASSWYLTDVFAGFEIWNGSDAKGLKDTFTCVIQ